MVTLLKDYCGISTPVVCILPKDEKRVRFSYPAQLVVSPAIGGEKRVRFPLPAQTGVKRGVGVGVGLGVDVLYGLGVGVGVFFSAHFFPLVHVVEPAVCPLQHVPPET